MRYNETQLSPERAHAPCVGIAENGPRRTGGSIGARFAKYIINLTSRTVKPSVSPTQQLTLSDSLYDFLPGPVESGAT
jgi:hypothetical protein